ncbi:MAG: IPT/TIG domain-containing protein [Sphingobacteriales bacterium]|jgi:hypothetical protein|nr:IPT/TIG domain-containing protein [Sphingobacteriales bacterium]OJW36825.1 MAG: hypothetical protein BGO54_06910 [Sphingobacteriales bacterium 46-32]
MQVTSQRSLTRLFSISFLCLFAAALVILPSSCSKKDDKEPPVPSISEFTSSTGSLSGPKNTEIIISGQNFPVSAGSIVVKVNGKECTILEQGANRVTAKIPARCGSGKVEVTINGKATEGPEFAYQYSYELVSVTNGIKGMEDGPINTAKFDQLAGIAIDADNNYYLGHFPAPKLRKVSAAGMVSLLAGNDQRGIVDGTGAAAGFRYPEYLSMGRDGNIYVADAGVPGAIRRVTPAGVVTTLATFENQQIFAVAATPTAIYATNNYNYIYKLDYNGSLIWSLFTKYDFMNSNSNWYIDGDTSVASFNMYGNITVDKDEKYLYFGNIYGPRGGNTKASFLRRLDLTTGIMSTLAGGNTSIAVDGPAAQARFNLIWDIEVGPDGKIYMAEAMNNRIRVYDNGTVSTLVGTAGEGDVDGNLQNAKIDYPVSLQFDKNGDLVIVCSGSTLPKIKKIIID